MSELLVGRDDLRRVDVRESPVPVIGDGEVLLAVSKFALTANNITYGAFGTVMGYWQFFPAPEGWGRIPVWGFAEVEASRVEGVAAGERVYGYFPMSSHLVVQPTKMTETSFVDGVAHRASLPPVYNQYRRLAAAPVDDASEAVEAILRPLFTTSFLIDDWLADNDLFGARAVVLSSASSKTALGLAFLLSTAQRAEVIGLTSPANAAFVEQVGYYDRTVVYGDLAAVQVAGPAVLVDMAGDGKVLSEVHTVLADRLVHSCRVGATHWEELTPPVELPGPAPSLFFAPDHVVTRTREWGPAGFAERLGDAFERFGTSVDGWLNVIDRRGGDAMAETYLDVLEGRARPDEGFIVWPSG